MRQTDRHFKFDWATIILYFLLVGFGLINIISASQSGGVIELFSFNNPYSKQLLFIGLSVILILLILAIDSKFYERFSSLLFLASLLSLVGLFLFGKNVNGATSWYGIGGMTLQPSEFAKAATALAVAKYVSDLNTDIKRLKDQLKIAIIIAVPAILILLQNDAGSTLVYGSFFFVLYREGLPKIYLSIAIFVVLISISALKIGPVITVSITAVFLFTLFYFRRKKMRFYQPIALIVFGLGLAYGVQTFYKHILQPHQQDRINLWLRLEKDPDKLERMKKTFAYNLNESEKAITSGGFTGKGFLEGTRTTGKFVPEQHTDYIFSTIGEEWGFLGTMFTIILFILLLLRVLHLAELQKSQFSRVYGYSVAAILFFHFMINIGMVMGLIPTIGIPLPFFSYGGSGLWGFTILLFIFIKLDSNKINEW